MSPEDLLLAACINSSRRRFVRLKNMLDIAEAARQVTGDRWATFVNTAKAAGCQNIVYAAIVATKQAVGCDIPEEVVRGLNVSRWRAGMINRMIRFARSFSFDQLDAGVKLFGKQINIAVALPYATYTKRQLWGALWRLVVTRAFLAKRLLSQRWSKKAWQGAPAFSRLETSR